MAKITNPLFSIAASGTVGKITFTNTNGKQTARALSFRRPPQPTEPQQTVRDNCRTAAAYWAALTPDERAEWAARGLKLRYITDPENLTTLNNGWALFLSEWCLQQSTIDQPPYFPT
jgi:hypothetical protein